MNYPTKMDWWCSGSKQVSGTKRQKTWVQTQQLEKNYVTH